ncbi:RNA-binding protein 40 [Copidosoma floridanum]|uniref:RNA-binding protein 40 n=1 Tax=Copidosoma floridanum TaxID=29053 RepID=UPI000C6FC92E|nr:RNA-binding protein 40 [Copidosoma floridanum]
MTERNDICTLRVLHLPPGLPDEKRDELFKLYGAVKTRTVRRSAKYTTTFVEFTSKEHAEEVFLRLHQLPVKGRRLSIEYAKRNISDNKENDDVDEEAAKKEAELAKQKANFKEFINKLNTWTPHGMLSQPIPPNLAYKYPAPTKMTLLRIAIQLKKEPAFYTQVLHLMNKMCLPPPFEGLEKEYPQLKEFYDMENYKDLFDITIVSPAAEGTSSQEIEKSDHEEEESEIESDEESPTGPKMIIPEKRKKLQSKRPLKIPKFIDPRKQLTVPTTNTQKHKPKDVFESVTDKPNTKRKIDVKILAETANKPEDQMPFVIQPSDKAEGFGLIFPRKDDDQEHDKDKEKPEFISTEELHNNKITTHDQRLLPVFKNYHPGKPSARLYIKNLAKQVEESDLHFIYKRYVLPSSSGTESEYNVRLMQEGRMKGQAFVTLPNVAQAQLALDETNGYILKEKPMVVQFAKVSK